jgi:hypothetical protein
VLNSMHECLSKTTDDGGVDSGGHQPECIACGDKTVVGLQVLEPALNDANIRQAGEPITERSTHRVVGMDQPQTFEHADLSWLN